MPATKNRFTVAAAATWLFLLTVAVVFAVIGFGGTRMDVTSNYFGYSEYWEHGWPLKFMERSVSYKSQRLFLWDGNVSKLSRQNLAVDLLVYVAILASCTTWIVLRWRRQPEQTRRWSFSLASLLVIVMLVSIVLADVGRALSVARHERAIGEELSKLGHTVTYHYGGPTWIVRLSGEMNTSLHMVFEGIIDVEIKNVPDSEVGHLRELIVPLRALRGLTCQGAQFTDASLEELLSPRQRATIESLGLSSTGVRGKAFANPREWPQLVQILAANTPFDDESFATIALLPKLEWIDVSNTKVTKLSLQHAATMRQLTVLEVSKTAITKDDCAALTKRGVACFVD